MSHRHVVAIIVSRHRRPAVAEARVVELRPVADEFHPVPDTNVLDDPTQRIGQELLHLLRGVDEPVHPAQAVVGVGVVERVRHHVQVAVLDHEHVPERIHLVGRLRHPRAPLPLARVRIVVGPRDLGHERRVRVVAVLDVVRRAVAVEHPLQQPGPDVVLVEHLLEPRPLHVLQPALAALVLPPHVPVAGRAGPERRVALPDLAAELVVAHLALGQRRREVARIVGPRPDDPPEPVDVEAVHGTARRPAVATRRRRHRLGDLDDRAGVVAHDLRPQVVRARRLVGRHDLEERVHEAPWRRQLPSFLQLRDLRFRPDRLERAPPGRNLPNPPPYHFPVHIQHYYAVLQGACEQRTHITWRNREVRLAQDDRPCIELDLLLADNEFVGVGT